MSGRKNKTAVAIERVFEPDLPAQESALQLLLKPKRAPAGLKAPGGICITAAGKKARSVEELSGPDGRMDEESIP
jgi:hypothetical protein